MRTERTEIKKWGNSAALRLPAATLAKAGLAVNSPVEVHAVEGKVVVSVVTTPEYTLDQLLDACPGTKMTLSEEDRRWLDSEPAGREIW